MSNNYQIYIPQDTFKSFAIFNLIDVGMTYFSTTGTQNKKKKYIDTNFKACKKENIF